MSGRTANDPLRVLHTIGEMGTGGAESLVVEMVRRGTDLGWTSEVASAGGRREDELVRDLGTVTHRVPLSRRRPQGLARAISATRAAIRAGRPDVIIAHNVGVSAATWFARATLPGGRRIPIVTVFHGVAEADYPTAAQVLRRAPDAVVAVSGVIRDRLVAAGMSADHLQVIPNAITAPELPDRAAARAALQIPDDLPVALCVARLVDQKRHDVLLRAWAQVPQPALLLLAGDGPNAEALTALAGRLGLLADAQHPERVRILGARSDVPRLLAAADLTTLASDWEGLPIALLESMAAGRPVISTEVDGVHEALRHGGGLMVPRRDPQALAGALTSLLQDDEARQKAGIRAAEVVRTYYNPHDMMRRYDGVLREELNRPATNRTAKNRTAKNRTALSRHVRGRTDRTDNR